ncbi:MAG: hydrogenase maturation nickel metallochaperone HypA [Pirellulales bacterium]
MHELSIAHSMIELACETAQQHGAERVVKLRVRIGRLAGVVEDALRFSFGLAAEQTACQGAALEIEDVPVTVLCPDCGEPKVLAEIYRFRCPTCGTPTPKILGGQELELVSVEVADANAPSNS